MRGCGKGERAFKKGKELGKVQHRHGNEKGRGEKGVRGRGKIIKAVGA